MSIDESDNITSHAENVFGDSEDRQNLDFLNFSSMSIEEKEFEAVPIPNVSHWLDSEVKNKKKRKSTDETRAADAKRKRIEMYVFNKKQLFSFELWLS